MNLFSINLFWSNIFSAVQGYDATVGQARKNLANANQLWYNRKDIMYHFLIKIGGRLRMKHVKTLNANTLKESMKRGGCGECQTSCQSACKTSCTVGNQACENTSR